MTIETITCLKCDTGISIDWLIVCYPSPSVLCSWNCMTFLWVIDLLCWFFNHIWPDIFFCLSCSFLWRRRGKRSVRSTSPWGSMLSRPRSELWDAVLSISSAVSFPRKCFKFWFVWTFAVCRKYDVFPLLPQMPRFVWLAICIGVHIWWQLIFVYNLITRCLTFIISVWPFDPIALVL